MRDEITAVLIGALMIINVYAPDPPRNFEEYEKFMQKLKKVMQEGRKEGARRYFVAGDLNVDDDDLKEICGPQCWFENVLCQVERSCASGGHVFREGRKCLSEG